MAAAGAAAPPRPPNKLRVELLSARNLPVMDAAMLTGKGSSDPVVTLTFDGVSQKSTVKMKSLNPEWGEAFVWELRWV